NRHEKPFDATERSCRRMEQFPVPVVEGAGTHAHQDLPFLLDRPRDLPYVEDLRRAEAVADQRFHRGCFDNTRPRSIILPSVRLLQPSTDCLNPIKNRLDMTPAQA